MDPICKEVITWYKCHIENSNHNQKRYGCVLHFFLISTVILLTIISIVGIAKFTTKTTHEMKNFKSMCPVGVSSWRLMVCEETCLNEVLIDADGLSVKVFEDVEDDGIQWYEMNKTGNFVLSKPKGELIFHTRKNN